MVLTVLALVAVTIPERPATAYAASGGGCSPSSNWNGTSLSACISFDATANFFFGGYVGDGYMGGKIPAKCQLHAWFITADAKQHGREAEQWFDCGTGRVAVNESDYGTPWEKYNICLVVAGKQEMCVTSPQQNR